VAIAASYGPTVIFVIDTSSAVNALAILNSGVAQQVFLPARSPELVDRMRSMATAHTLTKVAVATGPGSFTGLRMGVSFGLGLAMGLRIPIVPLPTLGLQAARSDVPVLAVSEAGRGRVYFLEPAGRQGLAEPDELPRDWPVAGWLQPQTEAAVRAAGLLIAGEATLGTFAAAAAGLLESAREVAYGSLKLEYMQTFSASDL
jgi:tRNA A37 threonylcarbamoyladenosine modification protein TsaB